MALPPLAVVTGAFSFTGAAVSRSLHARGWDIRTLTNRVVPIQPLPFQVASHPLQFGDPSSLAASLEGARVLVNTYWVRYPHMGVGFDAAVTNTKVLLDAARKAGVERFVQISVSNPSLDSPLAYYRGKARVECLVRESGLSHAIVRPTLIVDDHDILVSNIAWFLRRFPVFAMPGRGDYRLQPVTLAEVGEIIADATCDDRDLTLDAAGPEILSFEQLVRRLASALRLGPRIVHVPPSVAVGLLSLVGLAVRDAILTREELAGLMSELLVSREPARGRTGFSEWLGREAGLDRLGLRYRSEAERHFSSAALAAPESPAPRLESP